TAGVAELLLQSHEDFIRILPALPDNWKNGSINGLKARGNIEVDLDWKDGKLVKLGLMSKETITIGLKYGTLAVQIELPKNRKIWLNGELKK
ncbi:MAG: glycoside hydrolase family 95-like protein, partial [Maribacter sp.]